MTENTAVKKLPIHLKDFIVDQNYSKYTPQDHAVWRYVMRRNLSYLSKVAHKSYLKGLKKTGISAEAIPSLKSMNKILEQIGWGAVCVDGFIPPAAFMEFQKHKVLVIAADIRNINHIEYTPAPDILHEAAGHAPIIADKNYAAYLRKFGEIGSKAFSSSFDYKLYEAIRHLSILKADPKSNSKDIQDAEKIIDDLEANPAPPSEMSLIRNLHWWTVEYGLIGNLNKPKIYGAGLLSSIGESLYALSDNVKKIPYTLEAQDYSFDITKPQPQLFVTPDFEHLNTVLDEFSTNMSLNIGGIEGLNKAIESKNLATVVMQSGLQISGVFTRFIVDGSQVNYVQTSGPTMLSFKGEALKGHGPDYHEHGYGTAVGKLKGTLKPMRKLTDYDLKEIGIELSKRCELNFYSGLTVKGVLKSKTTKEGKLLLLSFTDCTVQYKDKILFQPDWGIYDMAIGENIPSVFNGVADPEVYGLKYPPPSEKTHQIKYSDSEQKLFKQYQIVRDFRKKPNTDLHKIMKYILKNYPTEWLLILDLYELVQDDKELLHQISVHIKTMDLNNQERILIEKGMELVQL
jgi:phenylalanine-4-hydroxylase